MDEIGTATIQGTFGPCPNCGGTGKFVADNVPFSVSEGRITVEPGTLSAADLAVIASALSPFQSGDRSKKAIQQAITKVLPELAPEINGFAQKDLAFLITFILAMLAIIQNQLNSDGASIQAEQMMRLIRQQTNLVRLQANRTEKHWEDSINLDRERNELLRQQAEFLKEHLKPTPLQHENP